MANGFINNDFTADGIITGAEAIIDSLDLNGTGVTNKTTTGGLLSFNGVNFFQQQFTAATGTDYDITYGPTRGTAIIFINGTNTEGSPAAVFACSKTASAGLSTVLVLSQRAGNTGTTYTLTWRQAGLQQLYFSHDHGSDLTITVTGIWATSA